MALTPIQQMLSEAYFGDDSYLMFETSEDFSLAFNTAQEAVNQGHSWLEIYQTGGNKTSLRNLVVSEDPAKTQGSEIEGKFSAADAKGMAGGIEYWLGTGKDEEFIRNAFKGQGVSDDNLDRGFAYIEAKRQAKNRDVDLIFKASQLGVTIHRDMSNKDIEDAIKAHTEGGSENGGSQVDSSNQNNSGATDDGDLGGVNQATKVVSGTLADSINVAGREISFERLNPLIQYLNDKGFDTDIETIRSTDLTSPSEFQGLFPPEIVAMAKFEGIDLAGDLYPPDYNHQDLNVPQNAVYWNELTGIFGNNISLKELNPDAQNQVIGQVGPSAFSDFMNMPEDQKGPTNVPGVIIGFNGEPITSGRVSLAMNTRRGSKWYVRSLDHNNDGVIDVRDLQSYGRDQAIQSGISDPTHQDIKDFLNASPTDVQTYIDAGFNSMSSDVLGMDYLRELLDEAWKGYSDVERKKRRKKIMDGLGRNPSEEALSSAITQLEMEVNYPQFHKAMEDFNNGVVSKDAMRQFDFDGDGTLDFSDFNKFVMRNPTPTQDELDFLDSIGVKVNPRRERSTAADTYFDPVFQGNQISTWTDFILKSRADGLSDEDIRLALRGQGANADGIVQAFLGADTPKVAPDPNEGKLQGKTGSEIFQEKLENARKGTLYDKLDLSGMSQGAGVKVKGLEGAGLHDSFGFDPKHLPFVSPDYTAPITAKKETPDPVHSQELVDIQKGQQERVADLKAKSEKRGGFTPYTPTLPRDAFTQAQSNLSGESRQGLDAIAKNLGLKNTKNISDSGLKFTIASRQAANPEEVFGGPVPRDTPPKPPTQAEAPSG